jgi:hypothetical protein
MNLDSYVFGSLSGWTCAPTIDASPKLAKRPRRAAKEASCVPADYPPEVARALAYTSIFARVAGEEGVSRSHMSQVCRGKRKSQRVIAAIVREVRKIERNSPLPEINTLAAAIVRDIWALRFDAAEKEWTSLTPEQNARLVAACKESWSTRKPLDETLLQQLDQQNGGNQ